MFKLKLGLAVICGIAAALCLVTFSHPSPAHAATPALRVTVADTSTTPTTPPPPNDDRDNAQSLGALPASASGSTAGSTVESTEPAGGCYSQAGTVWYSVTFATAVPPSVGVRLQDGGNLDACIDVFTKVRSQSTFVTSADTDSSGLGRLTFAPAANTTYLIRVTQLANSDPGPFNLQVFDVPPGASAPGAQLPAAGARGELDSFFTTTASYSTELQAAVTYKLNLVNLEGGCMQLGVYAPGTTSFGDAQPLSSGCEKYRVFTPTQTGRYSFLITAASGITAEQPYALHVAPAADDEIAPGAPLENLQTVRGTLNGGSQSVVRLYSLSVATRSQLTLQLNTRANFGLELLKGDGRVVQCECGGSSGGDQAIAAITRPGNYYVAVLAQDFSHGSFSLSRQSRTITALRATANGHRAVTTSPGQSVRLDAHVYPVAVTGSVQFEVDYFDPLSGWQFRGYDTEPLEHGVAHLEFTPPVAGHWRVIDTFAGTRIAASADPDTAYFYDAPPLS